ncbi:MAG: DUF4920 domain-containing protein [Chitinophagales bacterium]|nr:DUF4920 domain-containing protein [Chitinophagales bacterium]MDW8392741.1 DUF4920 domain-containing protein [Chitinophagales bacterium]
MNLRLTLAVAIVALDFLSCKRTPSPAFYGKTFDTTTALSLTQLLDDTARSDRSAMVVVGQVQSVCQSEGCWMLMEDDKGRNVHVDWDKKFFIPKNTAGRRAYVYGYAHYDTTSVDELRQRARDAGKSEEDIQAITTPEVTVALKAEGVRL